MWLQHGTSKTKPFSTSLQHSLQRLASWVETFFCAWKIWGLSEPFGQFNTQSIPPQILCPRTLANEETQQCFDFLIFPTRTCGVQSVALPAGGSWIGHVMSVGQLRFPGSRFQFGGVVLRQFFQLLHSSSAVSLSKAALRYPKNDF